MAHSIRSATRPGLLALAVGAALALAACSGAATTAAPASAPAVATSAPNPVVSPSAMASGAGAGTSAGASAGGYSGGRYGTGGASTASPAAAGPSSGNAVAIVNYAFNPGTIAVKAGTKVTWTNAGVTHTVTADDGSFDSGSLTSGGTYSFTFAKPGSFTYHCAIHSSMTGVVTVSP